jgi:hypothetical protein
MPVKEAVQGLFDKIYFLFLDPKGRIGGPNDDES